MKRILLPVALVLWAFSNVSGVEPTGLPLPDTRSRLKTLVEMEPEVKIHWANVKQQADQALAATPQALEVIDYEGILATDPRRIETVRCLKDMSKIDALLQAWLVTNDERYEAAATRFITEWAFRYKPTGNPINENKLEPLISAYAVLRKRMDAGLQTRVDTWVLIICESEMRHAEQHPQTMRGNWEPKRLKLIALAGTILSREDLLRYARDHATSYIDRSLRADGSSYDFEHRDALGYHSGGIKPLLRLAALLNASGLSLYSYQSPSGASLKKSVEFMIPYASGDKVHVEFRNSKEPFDRKRIEAGVLKEAPYAPEKAIGAFEMASAFEPERYIPLVARLSGKSESRYPTWMTVLGHAGWLPEPIND